MGIDGGSHQQCWEGRLDMTDSYAALTPAVRAHQARSDLEFLKQQLVFIEEGLSLLKKLKVEYQELKADLERIIRDAETQFDE